MTAAYFKADAQTERRDRINFDRGLDIASVDENTALALEILLHSEN